MSAPGIFVLRNFDDPVNHYGGELNLKALISWAKPLSKPII